MNLINLIRNKLNTKTPEATNMVLIDATELADLRLRALDNAIQVPLSKEHLTMKQLGSYLPNFEFIGSKSDAFKNSIGLMCRNLIQSEEWKYLIEHLKQDQVNLAFFTEGVKSTDDWVRGSINGVYIVDDQINTLGASYLDREKQGLVGEKKNARAKSAKG